AHDAAIGREKFRAVGGEDRGPLAALEAARQQSARDAVRHGVELAVAELARRRLAAEIDDRGLGEIARAVDQVAEVGEAGHDGTIASTCAVQSSSPAGGG